MKKIRTFKGVSYTITIWYDRTASSGRAYSIDAADTFGWMIPREQYFANLAQAEAAAQNFKILLDRRQKWMAEQGRICQELFAAWCDDHPGGTCEEFIRSGDFDHAYRARTGRDFLPQPPEPESFV